LLTDKDAVFLKGFVTVEDPGPVGAGLFWFDPERDSFKIRNAQNVSWDHGSAPLSSDKKTLTSGDKTTNSTTFSDVDAVNMSITLATRANRVLILVLAAGQIDLAGTMCLDVDIDGVRQGQTFGLCSDGGAVGTNRNLSFPYLTEILTAGSHSFKLQFCRKTIGTFTLFASTAVNPLIMSALELPG